MALVTPRIPLALLLLALGAPARAQVITPGIGVGGQGGSGYDAIYQDYPNTALTGVITETNLAAVRIPAGTMGPKGILRISVLFTCTNNANNKTIALRFNAVAGATSGAVIGSAVVTTVQIVHGQITVRNANATNSQAIYAIPLTPFGSNAAALTTAALDTTVDTFVNINGQLAVGTDTMTLVGYTVEVLHP